MITLEEFEELQRVSPAEAARVARAILSESDDSYSEWCPHEPSGKQEQFLALDCLEACYGGAAGGGKSDALLMAALEHFDEPNYAAILFRRTYTELALPEAIMARSHEWLAGTRAHWDGTNKQWRHPTGGIVGFGYLDGPLDHTRYQSAAFQFVGFDELTQFTERPYRYLFSRLRRSAQSQVPIRMRSATNPGGIGHEWVKARFGIPDEIDFGRIYARGGRVFVPARRQDNAHLDHDSYSRALDELDSATKAQLDLGKWVQDSSGLVYGDFSERCIVDALPGLPAGETWTKIFAADFGVVDQTAFGVLAFNRFDPQIYVVESDQWVGLSPSESAERAIEWRERHGGFDRWVGDIGGLGKAFQAEWESRYHLPLEPADKTGKIGFIKLVNGDFRNGRFRIVRDSNRALIDCLREVRWKDDRRSEEHSAVANHLSDMALYGWRACRHWNVRPRTETLSYGSAEWLKSTTDHERAKTFAAVRKRLDRENRKLSPRELARKIASL